MRCAGRSISLGTLCRGRVRARHRGAQAGSALRWIGSDTLAGGVIGGGTKKGGRVSPSPRTSEAQLTSWMR
jgi:hypothetical protein